MKKFIKITAVIFSVAMIFGFASCTPSVSDDGNDTGTENTGSNTPEDIGTPIVTLSSIAVSGNPASTLYYVGDSFDSSGLTVTATYSDGSTKELTAWTNDFSSDEVSIGKTVTVSYTEGDVTKTATVSGTFYVAAAGAKPTESPIKLTDYTGTFEGGTYYKFGDFPQTISALTGENAYSAEPVYKDWYLGSDGYFYEKCTENAVYNTDYTYSDGTAVAESSANSEKYFKVEPIVWRAVTQSFDHDADGNGDKILLVAESILTANVLFYGSISNSTLRTAAKIYPNNYKYSNIRAYLNGTANQYVIEGGTATEYDIDWSGKGFIDTAFTATAQALIATTTVDNSAESTTDAGNNITQATDYFCDNTEDKIFLLSVKEATTSDYGITEYGEDEFYSRISVTTDYAKANYASNSGRWWLRSPYNERNFYSYTIKSTSSSVVYQQAVNSRFDGLVPALSISKEN